MVRPKICKRLNFKPRAHYFKPQGIPIRHLSEIELKKEELEAIKLKDYDGFEQTEAAEKMKISQSTFHRILFSARIKIARSIVDGKALRIEE